MTAVAHAQCSYCHAYAQTADAQTADNAVIELRGGRELEGGLPEEQNQQVWAPHRRRPSAVLYGCVVACSQYEQSQPKSCTHLHRQQSKNAPKVNLKPHL